MSVWQPIETAPKDGKRILLCGKWNSVSIRRWVGSPHDAWIGDDGFHRITDARHWQPLPEPPQ